MAKQLLNIGVEANDGSGDGLRTGGNKINDNINEIYNALGDGQNLLNSDIDFGTNKIFYRNMVQTETELNAISATTYHGMVMHVHETGSLYYAHAGSWNKLLTSDPQNNITNYTDDLSVVAYSGNYNDLQNRPALPTELTDIGIVDGSSGQFLSTDGLGNFVFRDVTATNIEFNDILAKPTTLAGYGINDAFSGDYADLANKPVLFSGSYADLTNKPTIATDVNELTDTDGLLFSGEYSDLNNKPDIPSDVNELTDSDQRFFSGSYDDLRDIPTFYANLNAISMALGVTVDEFSNDITLGDRSISALPTENAVRQFVENYVENQIDTLAATIPGSITDLDVTDGTSGQVLTTNGNGVFTFINLPDPGDTVGNFTLAASNIDTDDSSEITITPSLRTNSDLTVEGNVVSRGNINTDGKVTAAEFVSTSTDSTTPELFSESDILLTATDRVEVTQSPFKLAQFSTAQRDALTAEPGDMIYNTDTGEIQGYVEGTDSTPGWVALH